MEFTNAQTETKRKIEDGKRIINQMCKNKTSTQRTMIYQNLVFNKNKAITIQTIVNDIKEFIVVRMII